MLTVISFILILGVLILVHELGHFITAIKLGVKVEEFGIGFPPKMLAIKRKDIIYSLNWIPIGGFVKIKGESGEGLDDPASFVNAPTWKKLSIISAGVIMNFVLAFVLLSLAFYLGLPQAIDRETVSGPVEYKNVVIADVQSNSPAEIAGIEVGDEIILVNDKAFSSAQDVYSEISSSKALEITMKISRQGEELQFKLSAKPLSEGEEALVGIGMIDTGIIRYGLFGSIWQGLSTTGIMIWRIIQALYYLLADLISHGQVSSEFGGPVAVAVVTGQVVKLGWIYILQFAAVLSINLGVVNFFPFPALDGGRALFISVAAITRRKFNEKVEGWIHNSGFIVLVFLLVLITFRDFGRYGGQIMDYVKNIF